MELSITAVRLAYFPLYFFHFVSRNPCMAFIDFCDSSLRRCMVR